MADAITEIVQVNITASTATPTQQGFGVPCLVGYHNHFADLWRIYTGTAGMASDGFVVNEPLYLMAQAIFSQNPSPPSIVVGRLPAATARTFTITLTDATQGNVATLSLIGKDGVPHAMTRTVPAASSAAAEATAWAALINTALGALGAAAAVGAVITITPATVGDTIFAYGINPGEMTYADTAAAAGYAAALTNILNANPNWYGLAIEHRDPTNVAAVATWAEAQSVLFFANTSDTGEILGASTIGATLKAAAYKRTATIWTGSPHKYSAAAAIGEFLTYTPGSATLMFKQLTGVPADNLTPTQRANLDADNVNHYTTVAGLNIIRYGYASGGQFVDVEIGSDWLAANIKTAVFGPLANSPKIDYTDIGIAVIAGQVGTVLDRAVSNKFLAAGTTKVIPPAAANASASDKGNRILNNMQFQGTMAGAVHKVIISGNLSL